MEKIVTLTYARAHLDELIDRALGGDDIVITRRGKRVVRLVPVLEARRRPGALAGKLTVPDEFFDPLPAEELEAWGE